MTLTHVLSLRLILAASLLQPTFASEAYPIQTPQSSVPTAPPRMYLQKSQADDLSKEAYIMDFLSTKVRFENDGRGSRDLEFRAALLSESAVREFGALIYPYAASFESVEIQYVRVRKPDGNVVETPPSEAQELDSAVSREAPMHTDEREKHLAVKGLAVGDTLEVAVHWAVREPFRTKPQRGFFEGAP